VNFVVSRNYATCNATFSPTAQRSRWDSARVMYPSPSIIRALSFGHLRRHSAWCYQSTINHGPSRNSGHWSAITEPQSLVTVSHYLPRVHCTQQLRHISRWRTHINRQCACQAHARMQRSLKLEW